MVCPAIHQGLLRAAAPDLMYGLVTFPVSRCINLVDKANITAVDLVGANANKRA